MSVDLSPSVKEYLGQLQEIERANMSFSMEINSRLRELKPDSSEMPFIYIGSGGDLLSALLVSRSRSIVMVDTHPFLTKDGKGNEKSETYPSIQDMLNDVNPTTERIGVLTFWDKVRPAVQMLSQLGKVGIPKNSINIQAGGSDAEIRFRYNNQEIVVKFWSGRIESQVDLQSLLGRLPIRGEYGLMAKGGASGAVRDIISQYKVDQGSAPGYFVVDDPRSLAFRALTDREEALMFPGYLLTEIRSSVRSEWGYSNGEDPNSKTSGQEFEFDYGARAVIGIRDDAAFIHQKSSRS